MAILTAAHVQVPEFHAAFATVRYIRGLGRSDAVEMEWPPRIDWDDPVVEAASEATDLESQRESACVRATGTVWYAAPRGAVRHRHVEGALVPPPPPPAASVPSMGAGRRKQNTSTPGLFLAAAR